MDDVDPAFQKLRWRKLDGDSHRVKYFLHFIYFFLDSKNTRDIAQVFFKLKHRHFLPPNLKTRVFSREKWGDRRDSNPQNRCFYFARFSV